MGLFTYRCPNHGEFKLSLAKRVSKSLCAKCGTESIAVIKTGSMSIIDRLDNGAMARTVERLHNIEEIMNNRADKHSEEFDEQTKSEQENDDENL